MSFFNADVSADAVQESTGGAYLSNSGIYDVTLKIVSVDVNNSGARSLNFNVDYNGSSSTLYGLRLDNNDKTPNFQAKTFNKLLIVAGVERVSDPEVQSHKLGKDGIAKDLAVLTDFTDFNCKIRIQEEYSKYQGEIKKKLIIKNFYSETGASADELVNEKPIGEQLVKDEAYAANVTYKDGLTAADITKWEADKKAAKGGASAPTPTSTPAAGGGLFK
jgi:hypothetical protein